jgi:deoxycytidylate deaminase
MSLAEVAATRTTCIRKGVGCVLADAKGRVLAIAYNGVASGRVHCNEAVMKPVYHDDVRVFFDARNACFEFNGKRIPVMRHLNLARPTGESRLAFAVAGLDYQCVGHEDTYPHACAGHERPFGEPTSCEAVHAEQNAVLQCKDTDAIHTAYVTTAPCKPCMKLLLNTGCNRIVFLQDHPGSEEARAIWENAGREWVRLVEV